MTVQLKQVTFDCVDPYALSVFWKAVTGWEDYPGEPNVPEDEACYLGKPGSDLPGLFFQIVPEGKTVKNRLHLDVAPIDGTRNEEVARLLTLGATVVSDQRKSDGTGWVVMGDPEGNEFCVERSDAERSLSE
jgi:hypothetical protein